MIDKNIQKIQEVYSKQKDHSLNRLYNLHLNASINDYDSYSIKNYWEKLVNDIRKGKRQDIIDFYVHIPFCIEKCAYCNYYSKKPRDIQETQRYIEDICANMRFFKKTFEYIKFSTLYIGGGTPSILNLRQLNALLSCIHNSFKFENNGCKTFEFNPTTISSEKLDLIKKFRFNRISFGIQTFDKKILSAVNRPFKDYKFIKSIVQYAKKLNFKFIDADLIIDLKGRTVNSFIEDFKKLARLNLSEIEIFPLIPTKRYIQDFYEGDEKEFYKEHKKIICEAAKSITKVAKEFGYASSSLVAYDTTWGFTRQDLFEEQDKISEKSKENDLKNRHKKNRSGLNPEIFSFIGFGPSTISHIYGYLAYTTQTHKEHARFGPSNKLYAGTPLTEKDEMTRYIIGCIIKDSAVSKTAFRERFGKELTDNFAEAIHCLKALGKIREEEGSILFLKKEQNESFLCSLFFLGNSYLKLLDAGQRSFSC